MFKLLVCKLALFQNKQEHHVKKYIQITNGEAGIKDVLLQILVKG